MTKLFDWKPVKLQYANRESPELFTLELKSLLYDMVFRDLRVVPNEDINGFDVHYEQQLYCGPEIGVVEVHKRVISKDLIDPPYNKDQSDAINKFLDVGRVWVQVRMPSVISRVGCNCCYPDGPDLTTTRRTLDNGDLEVTYVVDFDFKKDEL